MNDCYEGLAVHCLKPWAFTLRITDDCLDNCQSFITDETIFRMVADGLCFLDDSVLGTRIFISTDWVDSIANNFDQGFGKEVS